MDVRSVKVVEITVQEGVEKVVVGVIFFPDVFGCGQGFEKVFAVR